MEEMTNVEKAERYDEAIKRAKELLEIGLKDTRDKRVVLSFFPELKKSKNEQSKNWILEYLYNSLRKSDEQFKGQFKAAIAWLEKQGKETSWKPSKEEMDVLYGLAYITNQYDEHKEEVITRLYQDLKREFFNGSSSENMFPTNTSTEDDVRRRSTIQVLEYARSLDAYNQFGKADIDKNIAWLEKQGEQSKWKPSKDEMDALYGLAYITNKMDDKKDEAITKLYQDLKRVLFDGASYENMFPSSPVNSNINIEKQGEQKTAEWSEEDEKILSNIIKDLVHPWNEYIPDRIEDEIKWLKNKLKSLRPQSTWKPSEMEMKALEFYLKEEVDKDGFYGKRIVELYNDLMKLKE